MKRYRHKPLREIVHTVDRGLQLDKCLGKVFVSDIYVKTKKGLRPPRVIVVSIPIQDLYDSRNPALKRMELEQKAVKDTLA